MRKTINLALVGAFALGAAITFGSCEKDGPENTDIHTGVMLGGGEIVVRDRNAGAANVGDVGSYLTWDEAVAACPAGYHLMTKAEASAIIADENYNTTDKLVNGTLKMPCGGYIGAGKTEVEDLDYYGDYHLADEYDGDNNWYIYFGPSVINIDFYNKADRQSVRCVKN